MERIQEALGTAMDRHLRLYFAAHEGRLPQAGLYERVLREIERPLFTHALAACQGNQVQAAKLLGLNRNTLRKKLQELEIAARPYRKRQSETGGVKVLSRRLQRKLNGKLPVKEPVKSTLKSPSQKAA